MPDNRNFECHVCGHVFRRPHVGPYVRRCPKCGGGATVQMKLSKHHPDAPRRTPRP